MLGVSHVRVTTAEGSKVHAACVLHAMRANGTRLIAMKSWLVITTVLTLAGRSTAAQYGDLHGGEHPAEASHVSATKTAELPAKW